METLLWNFDKAGIIKKRGKRKSLQWAIFKAKNLKRIRTGRYSK